MPRLPRVRLPLLPAALLLLLSGCGSPKPELAPPITAEIPAKTELHAMLAKQLESGVDEEGTDVPMVLTDDVRDNAGHILIAQGTPLTGKVTWSRKADALSGLTNRPARLKFQFLTVKAVDGTAVAICADPDQPDEPFELNRSNTKRENVEKHLEELAKDEKGGQVLTALTDLFEKGDTTVLDSQENRAKLSEFGKELNMPELQSLNSSGDVDKIKGLLSSLRSGQSLGSGGSQGQLALLAISELAEVAGSVGNVVGRMTRGRNIKAYPGTSVTAYVKQATPVTLRP